MCLFCARLCWMCLCLRICRSWIYSFVVKQFTTASYYIIKSHKQKAVITRYIVINCTTILQNFQMIHDCFGEKISNTVFKKKSGCFLPSTDVYWYYFVHNKSIIKPLFNLIKYMYVNWVLLFPLTDVRI